ncbi:enoyl-CoA hydratase/isomerase family protein [Parahaliea maris]|uniref:Enoyl-CoA hydratase/isomerase family protein n=1 Tax=Parahaliea maris TaxID=2716870 RepID=A0A5C9A4P1_9GAMM|nr:enoyl-CoA hydratase/isomerase family protein [Parahaliea maris]TXS95845.1 enoyl-CoA hydratase/isomerase family protein [Parahaliea maris]
MTVLSSPPFACLDIEDLPADPQWLHQQPHPVIALGESSHANADIVIADDAELQLLAARIEQHPLAALTLVQVLRAVEMLPLPAAMTVESLAYASLQSGSEFRQWLQAREATPREIHSPDSTPAIVVHRQGDRVQALLNRPQYRNSITVEMRDALIELFELVLIDNSIRQLHLSGRGACFSVGGELREFGLATDPSLAHWIRSCHNPGRLLSRCADRVHVHVHSACLGSGIELPAFAGRLSASPGSFFQLPELAFGLIPGAGGCVSIARRIGRQRTAWMALSGKKINARQARQWGLIDAICDSVDTVD